MYICVIKLQYNISENRFRIQLNGCIERCEPTTIKIVSEVDKYKCTEIDQKMDSVLKEKRYTTKRNDIHKPNEQARKKKWTTMKIKFDWCKKREKEQKFASQTRDIEKKIPATTTKYKSKRKKRMVPR